MLSSLAPRCLQRVRQCEPRALLAALLPSKAYRVPWGAPAQCPPPTRGWAGLGDNPTATGVTRSFHRTALAENFLSRGLIFRQVTPQSSRFSAWGKWQAGRCQPWVRLASSGPFLTFSSLSSGCQRQGCGKEVRGKL